LKDHVIHDVAAVEQVVALEWELVEGYRVENF
jgi:hypothetical protein